MLNVYMAIANKLSKNPEQLEVVGVVFWVAVSCIGFLLWLYTYVLAMRFGRQYKSYAIPFLAVCLNFAWEALASFVWQFEFSIWHIGSVLWMLFDVGVVYQLYRYGARVQLIPEIRDNFHRLMFVVFPLCAVGQLTFTRWTGDAMGIVDSFIINLVMSVSFIFMYFARREADDLTYSISWYKMLGTGIVSVTMIPLFPLVHPGENTGFMWFVCPLIFLVDCLYIRILAKARREAAGRADTDRTQAVEPSPAVAAA